MQDQGKPKKQSTEITTQVDGMTITHIFSSVPQPAVTREVIEILSGAYEERRLNGAVAKEQGND